MSTEEEEETPSTIPKWVIYAGVGIASYVVYKTLFKETNFIHEHRYDELKSDDFFAEYPPSSKYYSTNPWDEMPIRRSSRGPGSWKPIRIFELFAKSVSNSPNSIYWKKEYLQQNSTTDYEWKSWTRKQIYDSTKQAARAFIACGLQPWQSVSIMGFNSPQWILSDLGAIYAGGIVAGIYTTNNSGQCTYILAHSKSAILVVENKKQLVKFLEIRKDLIDLKVIVVWDIDENDPIISKANTDNDDEKYAKVIHWNEFMKLGDDKKTMDELNKEMTDRISKIKPGHCCTLIYTSGTTGTPKAVMLSHDNITWQSRVVLQHIKSIKKDGSPHASISYLPLSHVAAQLLDIYFPMSFTANYPACKLWEMYFARPTALKGTLVLTLREARPTLFFGVPRVYEKMQESLIKKSAENSSYFKSMLISYLKTVCVKAYYSKQLGGDMVCPFGYSLADKLLISKVKSSLGFDRVQELFTGAAPISQSTLEFWGSLGIDIIEVYGMSECSGVHTVSLAYYNKLGTVGVPLPSVNTLLENDPNRQDSLGHGEICMRGRHVMMGYMYDLTKTKNTIDSSGYLHSGDIGFIDDEYNLLKITGRIKELIITAGGENIAPVPIEDYIKSECPSISNIIIIGDKKKYLTALMTLKNENNVLESICKEVDPNCNTVDDTRKSEKWSKYIQNGIDKYNNDKEYCVSNAQKIQYFRILNGDFSTENGELTATMKLKRPVVIKKYDNTIQSMYTMRVKT